MEGGTTARQVFGKLSSKECERPCSPFGIQRVEKYWYSYQGLIFSETHFFSMMKKNLGLLNWIINKAWKLSLAIPCLWGAAVSKP